ncbi:polygalacturonase At1g48100 [Lactuca sativa]|nr:polygalacturonase At1g48100 [Lactuca sativa]
MKQNMKHYSVFLSSIFVFYCLFTIIEGRKFHSSCKKHHKGYGHSCNSTTIFNIMSFGAKASGVSDDSKKLVMAWKSACKVPEGVVQIPLGHKFLIKPVTLQGPCTGHVTFQIDGTLLAPSKIGSWSKSNLFQWINFKWVQNLTIQGSGIVDGQGYNWWNPMKSKHISDIKPTALRFYASEDITIRDITINNSPQVHLKFDNSRGVKVNNITISSPGNSPNTDGIHLQNTRDVEIMYSNIGTGDDCVSIQTGCSNVHIHHINCGPGHGISIGGLGKDKSIACVSDILIENSIIENTLYGARIKTWQGGVGLVKNVTFSNIQIVDVNFPIVINQYYCDKSLCQNQTGSIAIKGVNFDKIVGTYSTQPIHLACSDEIPCTDIDLSDIQLKPSRGPLGGSQLQQALCWNSYGKSKGPLVPYSINYCLRKGGDDSIHPISGSSNELC